LRELVRSLPRCPQPASHEASASALIRVRVERREQLALQIGTTLDANKIPSGGGDDQPTNAAR
jgi:hypothetical protein